MIEFMNGDLLKSDCDIRCHQVNCKGVMGSGLALQVKKKYSETFSYYQELCNKYGKLLLGRIQYTECHDGYYLANMFGQDRYGRDKCHTDYEALEKCISTVYDRASTHRESVGFPYLMGCDRGGGDWNKVLALIEKYFKESDVICKIYQFK